VDDGRSDVDIDRIAIAGIDDLFASPVTLDNGGRECHSGVTEL
jgi:hypothetical protein